MQNGTEREKRAMDAIDAAAVGEKMRGDLAKRNALLKRGLPGTFSIAQGQSRGGFEERGGGTRGGQSMKVLIHQSSCTALLGSPAVRCRPWLWGDGR